MVEDQKIARQKMRMCVIDVTKEKQVVSAKFAHDMPSREVVVVTGN